MEKATDNSHRASFIVSKLFRFFGNDFLCIRIVGALLGAIAAAIVVVVGREFFSRTTAAILSLLAVFAPQTAFYSVRFLKEVWIVFAVALALYGFMMIVKNKKSFAAAMAIAAAVAILLWVRLEYGLIFLSALPVAICFRYKNHPAIKIAAVAVVVLLGIGLIGYQYSRLADKAEYLYGQYDSVEYGMSGKYAIIDRLYNSNGLMRLVNIPSSMFNPLPKKLHQIYTKQGGLYDIILKANIYQWWLPLPFLIIGSYLVITKRPEFLSLLLPYIVVICTAAMLHGAFRGDMLRYRDSLAPMVFIITGLGVESFLESQQRWKNTVIAVVYGVFVLLAIGFCIL